jgi:hypothetical protein
MELASVTAPPWEAGCLYRYKLRSRMNEACWLARPIPGLEIDTGSSRKFEQTQVLFCFVSWSAVPRLPERSGPVVVPKLVVMLRSS